MDKQIKAGMSAHEALTILTARADAESGAGIITAEEHDAITTITESPDRATVEGITARLRESLKAVTDMYEAALNGKYDDPDEAEIIDKARAILADTEPPVGAELTRADVDHANRTATPLTHPTECEPKHEEDTCPECAGQLDLEAEESDGDGEGRASWTCPECGAEGVQVREVVFKRHEGIKTGDEVSADEDRRIKAAQYPDGPRTMYNDAGTFGYWAIGDGSGRFGPQITRAEARKLLDKHGDDGKLYAIYCKEASDTPGEWAAIECGDMDGVNDGELPDGWETFEICFPSEPHEFER